jgi:carbon-monoxide dehydrogenase medium subunit
VKPSRFSYEAPTSLEQCVSLLERHGPDAKPLAGGQSLVPLMNLRLAAPTVLVDLGRVAGLDRVEERDGRLCFGAMTRHMTVAESDLVRSRCPLLSTAASLVGYPAIRVRGTIGGSLAHADPAAELALVAVTVDAELDVLGPSGHRVVAASDFFHGYFTTALGESELLTEVRFPVARPTDRWAFEEFSRKSGDFAVAAAAVQIAMDGDRIAHAAIGVAGAQDRPVRAPDAEASLAGLAGGDVDFHGLAAAAAREVLSDDQAREVEERRLLTAVVVRRALERALGEEGARG